MKCYENAFKRGEEIVVITFSSKLSGTYSSAKLASDMFDDGKITVIDSLTAVGNYRYMISEALRLAGEDSSMEKIVERIDQIRERMGINLMVESLEYLKRGGRLSNMQAVIGSLLNIKPIIGLIDGKLIAMDKVRGKKKALDLMIAKIPSDAKRINVEHVEDSEAAEKLKRLIEIKFKNSDVSIHEIGPVIGSHIGPKAIGVGYMLDR